MTIPEELRQWAATSKHTHNECAPMWFHLWDQVCEFRTQGQFLVLLKPDDRRTFALLVAKAMES